MSEHFHPFPTGQATTLPTVIDKDQGERENKLFPNDPRDLKHVFLTALVTSSMPKAVHTAYADVFLPEHVLARFPYGVDRDLLSVGVICVKDLWGAAGLGDEDALGQIGGRDHWGARSLGA